MYTQSLWYLNCKHSNCLFHLQHDRHYYEVKSISVAQLYTFVSFPCKKIIYHFTYFITATLQIILLFFYPLKKDTATPISLSNISSSFSNSITTFFQFSAHFSRLNSTNIFSCFFLKNSEIIRKKNIFLAPLYSLILQLTPNTSIHLISWKMFNFLN